MKRFAGLLGKKRRRAWVALAAGPVMLLFLASCDEANTKRQSAATAWQRTETVYFHQGVAAGPVLTTSSDGTLREERRYEPFGQPVNANLGGATGPVDFRREQQNSLGKLTNPNSGWSYHGARWMQPQAARWTAPDPAIKGVGAKALEHPWSLNPYAYVNASPVLFWDPDGLELRWVPATAVGPGMGASTRADVDRLRGLVNANLHGHRLDVSPAGVVTVSAIPGTHAGPREREFVNTLNNAINDTDNTTTIQIVNNEPLTRVGSYAAERLDVADVKALASGGTHGRPPTVLGLVGHEVGEQYMKQSAFHDPRYPAANSNQHYEDAHRLASAWEDLIEGGYHRHDAAIVGGTTFTYAGTSFTGHSQVTFVYDIPGGGTFNYRFNMDPTPGPTQGQMTYDSSWDTP